MILDEIFLKTREKLEKRKTTLLYDMFRRSSAANPFFPRDVCKTSKRVDNEIKIIAKVKKASPSRGILREDFDPLNIVLNYEKNSAAALSILTEPSYPRDSLEYLNPIRRYTQISLLRRDFIFNEYQILEALVYGVDFIFLVARMLSIRELKRPLESSRHLGLEVLVEIHNKEDSTRVILFGVDTIGISHRNLNDFTTGIGLCEKPIPQIPNSKTIIAESGLEDKELLKELQKMSADAFLISEYFMGQNGEDKALKASCED